MVNMKEYVVDGAGLKFFCDSKHRQQTCIDGERVELIRCCDHYL
jgi:hypothetical protein